MSGADKGNSVIYTTVKVLALIATSAIAIPYSVALIANSIYGWPLPPNKYKRAFHPKKVWALNQAVFQQLSYVRFARVFFKSQQFYATAGKELLIKDLFYGRHDNRLDVYMPPEMFMQQRTASGSRPLNPTIIYVFGGAWGGGDKNIYGSLCNLLASRMRATVVCPNYSTYPKGYVDDMVQDIVDTIAWVHQDGYLYGADKNSIMLIGHSSGAHLSLLAVLELALQRALHQGADQEEQQQQQLAGAAAPMKFEERHYSEASPPSSLHPDSLVTESFVYVESQEDDEARSSVSQPSTSASQQLTSSHSLPVPTTASTSNFLDSIKTVVGLAGVYDIADHFQHETKRGIEDLSTMTKAMYSPEHFSRFSPTRVMKSLPENCSLPPIRLLHGSADITVPVTSSHKMAAVLTDHGATNASSTVIEGCGHIDICMDLMDDDRPYHNEIIQVIAASRQQYM